MKKKLAEWINVVFGFRKMLLVLILYAVGIIFRLKNLISGSEMVDLFKSVTVAFMTANMGEHITTTVKDYISSKTNGTPQKEAIPEAAEGGPAADTQPK